MRFEKINDDKLRITFNLDDLREKNISYHDFMSDSIETQSIFFDMLKEAEKEVGFVTADYQLMIEALASSDGSFVLTVTRSKEKKEKARRTIKPKKLTQEPSEHLPTLVYYFNNFDNFQDLCISIDDTKNKIITKTFSTAILYLYNNKYYLVLKTNPKADVKNVKKCISILSEYSTHVLKNSEIFQNKLTEYGKILIKNNCFLKFKQKTSKK